MVPRSLPPAHHLPETLPTEVACPLCRSYYDELAGGPRHLARSKALSYIEFLEALGRTADMVSPPTQEQLEQVGGSALKCACMRVWM